MSDEVAFRVRSANLDMDRLYNGEIEDVRRALGPLGVSINPMYNVKFID